MVFAVLLIIQWGFRGVPTPEGWMEEWVAVHAEETERRRRRARRKTGSRH